MTTRKLLSHAFLMLPIVLGCGTPMPPPNVAPAPLATAMPVPPPEQPEGLPRTVIVISDLHFGIGWTPQGQWDAYEDFRYAKEWATFLQHIDQAGQEGGGGTDLILNGDTFELWQSRTADCRSHDADRGCSEPEAVARVRRITQVHFQELRNLGLFAATGQNRVVIVPGNHDAALLFPSVAAQVLQTIGAPPERVSVSSAGYWISRDRRIYADHGHQIGLDPNRYENWPMPFRLHESNVYLTRPWGEQFMQAFYDTYEDRYPIIDNIVSESDAVGFAVVREREGGLVHAVGKFLGFMLLKTSWGQRIELGRLKNTTSPRGSSTEDHRPRDQVYATYLDTVLAGLRGHQVAGKPFDVYVFSHTHNLDAGFELPVAMAGSGAGAQRPTRVINSGAWQRVVSADWLKRELARRNIPVQDVLTSIRLEDLPPCYGAVRIRPYEAAQGPRPEALYWRSAPGPNTPAAAFTPTCE